MEPIECEPAKTLEAMFDLYADCERALQRRKNLPTNELIALAEKAGFRFPPKGSGGSHMVGKHPTHKTLVPLSDIINIQSDSGKAKPYQVKQVVGFIQLAQPK